MIRAYRPDPVDATALQRALAAGRRAPSAGNTDARSFLVLEGADTARYWDVSLPLEHRESFPWPGLLVAPVLVVVLVRPDAYVRRYAEPDKARTGLGTGIDAWPVPYWWVDGGMAAQAVIDTARGETLGVCFFGLFAHEAALLGAFGVPDEWRAVGTIALGHPDLDHERPSRSSRRVRPPLDAMVHRGHW
jgi:nitroreductase